MLQITNDLTANKFIYADSYNEIDIGKVMVETINNKFGTEILISKVNVAFARFRQALNTALILDYFDLVGYV